MMSASSAATPDGSASPASPGESRHVLPPLPRAALLLDLDGTLIDIAATPDAVTVPADLLASLQTLRMRLDGALAVISGRPVEQVVSLLGDAVATIAGEHGAAIRFTMDAPLQRVALPTVPESWFAAGARIAAAHPGSLCERKAHGFVLHYRQAPAAGPALRAAMAALVDGSDRFAVAAASMAWELRARGADKGAAVRALMAHAPFAGRLPVFIGDDVTDEDGIAAARAMGGAGLRVPETFGTPEGVRTWLRAAAASGAW